MVTSRRALLRGTVNFERWGLVRGVWSLGTCFWKELWDQPLFLVFHFLVVRWTFFSTVHSYYEVLLSHRLKVIEQTGHNLEPLKLGTKEIVSASCQTNTPESLHTVRCIKKTIHLQGMEASLAAMCLMLPPLCTVTLAKRSTVLSCKSRSSVLPAGGLWRGPRLLL